MKKETLLLVFYLISQSLYSQVGINTTTPNAQLEIKSTNQATPTNTDGILIPKVDAFPATLPTAAQQGMLVYLTTTVGANPPGFYYWNNPTTTWIGIGGGATGSTLDQAYDFGGAGLGKTITADAGALTIAGTDGLASTGTLGSGAVALAGDGVKMFWNPRKAAFRAGESIAGFWDDANVGQHSVAFGIYSLASGNFSSAFGNANATGAGSFAAGYQATASGISSLAFGRFTTASGSYSSAFGLTNTSYSIGETVLGIGATPYTISTNGNTQFRAANAADRLFVVGNAVDLNNNNSVDDGTFATDERRNAFTILKSGRVSIGNITPGGQFELSLNEGRKPGTTTWTVTSDERLKTVNSLYNKGLNEIMQLRPVLYNYKNVGSKTFEKEVLETEFSGFLAQEVQPLFPEAVGADDDGYLNFNMHPILVASINAIKELKAENDSLKAELINQNELLDELLERVQNLENKN
ncbi:tail fiber domain-containing protein [Flavobacterium capsici]|uniref:Tail fiber domain-containing protein n=1 Tax=Flavobacterium capsici TaxID=3075618 RepID=A0AA96F2K4_9FLAO|nr:MULTISPECIES: tail fiber domain-containing protein [unclassified Flavobacterium]WNM18711.1 tail fiber domain-containing protein [Flavobacterium sp. PMR2A8]WNM22762.1 tail fiber domain-containing protein [Flavobacterium sp. PMTSA4]